MIDEGTFLVDLAAFIVGNTHGEACLPEQRFGRRLLGIQFLGLLRNDLGLGIPLLLEEFIEFFNQLREFLLDAGVIANLGPRLRSPLCCVS